MIVAVILLLGPVTALHLFAAAENTYLVSQSSGLQAMYRCKDRCLALNGSLLADMKVLSF